MSDQVVWKSSLGEYFAHAEGRIGEQMVLEWAGKNGYAVIYGASGSQRSASGSPNKVHQPTTKGIDMILFRPSDGQVLIVDNKAGGDEAAISKVSSFETDLRSKLQNRIRKIEAARGGLSGPMQAHMNRAIATLSRAERALGGKGKWPGNLSVVLSNAGGNSTGMTAGLSSRLRSQGIQNIEFLDFRGPRVQRQTIGTNAAEQFRLRQRSSSTNQTLTRLGSFAKLGLTGFGMARTLASTANMLAPTPGLATASYMLDPKGIMKEYIIDDIKALERKKPDVQGVKSFFNDPATSKGIRVIDVLHTNLPLFRQDLANFHANKTAEAGFQLFGLAFAARNQTTEEQALALMQLDAELEDYHRELDIVSDNLQRVKDMAPQVLATADGADDVAALFEHRIIAKEIFDAGMTVPEMAEFNRKLKVFSKFTREAFLEIDALIDQVDRQQNELQSVMDKLVHMACTIYFAPIAARSAPPDASDPESDRDSVLAVLPTDIYAAIPLDEIKRRVREAGFDFIPSVEKVLADLESKQLVMTSSGVGNRHGKVWYKSASGYIHRPVAD